MIPAKVDESFHRNETRTLEWPYGAKPTLLFDNPSYVFSGVADRIAPDGHYLKSKHLSAAIFYMMLREAAWQAINTNSFPAAWCDLSEENKEKWHDFVVAEGWTSKWSGRWMRHLPMSEE